jgi:hypothetical protein
LKDENKSKKQLIAELQDLRERITNMETERKLQRYAERLRVLHELDQAILVAESPKAIAKAALGHIRQLVSCQRASIALFDFEADEAVILAVNVNGHTCLEGGAHLPLLDSFGSLSDLRNGRPRIVENVSTQVKLSRSDRQLFAEGN